MKRTAIAVSMSLSMAPAAAFADDWSLADWSIKSTAKETVELNSNQFLQPTQAGTLGSYSTIIVNSEARTPDSKFNFDSDATYKKYWGPGVADQPESEYLNYGFHARYEIDGKSNFDKEFVDATWRSQSAALAVLNDLGLHTTATGAFDRATVTGGLDRSLSALDIVSLLATSTYAYYDPSSGGTPFTDTLARGVWRHNLNSVTTINASSEGELLQIDNTFNSNAMILRDQLGIEATLSPLLTFRGNAGVAYVQVANGIGTLTSSGVGSITSPVSGAATDWIGDLLLTYKMLKDTTLTLTATQSIGPNIVGGLTKRDVVEVALVKTINRHSTLSFTATGTQSTSSNSTYFASAKVAYDYQFTQDWRATLSYRYLHRFPSTGTANYDPITGIVTTASNLGPANSNSLMATFSRSFTELPGAHTPGGTGLPSGTQQQNNTKLQAQLQTQQQNGTLPGGIRLLGGPSVPASED